MKPRIKVITLGGDDPEQSLMQKIPHTGPSAVEFSIGHIAASKDKVDHIMAQGRPSVGNRLEPGLESCGLARKFSQRRAAPS